MDPVLLVTSDDALLDHLLRLAAAAGVTPEVAPEGSAALAGWAAAEVVVVGGDAAPGLATLRPPRRDGVHLVALDPLPPGFYEDAVGLGAETAVALPSGDAWLVETLTDVGDGARPAGAVIGVVGGAGGAGATTFAAALGQVAARAGEALVVDCDPCGPGTDLVLGLDGEPGVRWDALARASGRLSARALREVVPRRGRLGVLGWPAGAEHAAAPLDPTAAREALSAAARGHDTVVVDLPRAASDLVDELAARCRPLVVVVPATVPGVASAARLRRRFARHRDLALVVRGGPLDVEDVAAAVDAPVLARMRDQRGLHEAVDLGLGPVRTRRGPLAAAAAVVLEHAGPVPSGWAGRPWAA